MRRYLFVGALVFAVASVNVPSAVAQHHQQHAQAAAQTPLAFHHHHYGGNANVFSYWSAGYPLIWGVPYTPVFGPYYYAPYYTAYSFSLPTAGAPLAPADAQRGDPLPNEAEAAKDEPRASSADQKTKAGRYVGLGDANFARQKYFLAVERYKSAAQMAPDLAEPYFRQAYAMVALGQYASAAKVFRRGLKIRSDWSDSPFRLNLVYGDGKVAKTDHFERLAKAVEANPLDASLLTVLGLELFFDGQIERAGVFLTRAAQLGGNSDRLLDDFLPKPGPAGAQRAGPAKIVF